jgi:hypothetical protein
MKGFRSIAWSSIAGIALAIAFTAAPAAHGDTAPAGAIDFNRDIRPILSDKCFACHGPDDKTRKARLRLDERDDAIRPARSGATPIAPGKPDESEVLARVLASDPADRMPPPETGKSLSPEEIERLKRWIADGAPYEGHWAFTPPVRPPVPLGPADDPWIRNPIDGFILERLRAEGLSPSPEADRATLIRRATLDLTGLPPSPDELDAFLADPSDTAYDHLVDRLLESPRYGERMAVEWLDAARYADTHGYHLDSGRDMTAWRDWVIRAYNDNKPFDEFTVEQLAGDLLPNPSRDQLIATGFNRNHMINYEGGAIAEEYHYAYLVDRVNTTATVWLGLTMACAQCHDHKYDPISLKEYYQFLAFFNQVPENGLDGNRGNAAPLIRLSTPELDQELERLRAQAKEAEARWDAAIPEIDAAQEAWDESREWESIKDAPEPVRKALATSRAERTPEDEKKIRQYYRERVSETAKTLRAAIDSARKAAQEFEARIPTTMVMASLEKPRETRIRMRGQYDQLGETVQPGAPAALPPMGDLPPDRLGLARWLVDPRHPLTARVTVNRVWQMFFGTGLVKTPEDFGSQGAWPSHPELLDWLAREFVDTGWDLKRLQRLILTSATYRQSSRVTPEALAADPENTLLARAPRLRLPAEFIRDQALELAGLLHGPLGGASVFPYQPPGLWAELSMREDSDRFSAQVFVPSKGADLYRRSMYTFWKRSSPPPQLSTFDAPNRETCTVKRPRTNTPLQALILLNDPTYVEASRKLAERLMQRPGGDAERVAWAFRLATSRYPTAREHTVLLRILQEQRAHYRSRPDAAEALLSNGDSPTAPGLDRAELAAWTLVASTLLNLDETITRG